MTVVLVRHAVALARQEWNGDDRLRPLTARGVEQAAWLVRALDAFPVASIYSSPAVRCRDTVAPLAMARGLRVEQVESLAEGCGADAAMLVERDANVVLCGHGDNLPQLLLGLAGHLDDVPSDPPFAKGAVWILEREHGKVRSASYLLPGR